MSDASRQYCPSSQPYTREIPASHPKVAFRPYGFARVLVASLLSLGFLAPGHAQPPVFKPVDGNNVNVATGGYQHAMTDVVIGQPDNGGLEFTRYGASTASHNHLGYISSSGNTCYVVIGNTTRTFSATGSNCTGTLNYNEKLGARLDLSNGLYTLITADGTEVLFKQLGLEQVMGMPGNIEAYILNITMPGGKRIDYGYESDTICVPFMGNPCGMQAEIKRLGWVQNDLGYRLRFEYAEPPIDGATLTKVYGINKKVEYCHGWDCAEPWPQATYDYDGGFTVTDSLGNTTAYTRSGGQITEIQFPDDAVHDINISYSSGRVSSIDRGFGTWTYSYADSDSDSDGTNDTRTTTVLDPDGQQREYLSDIESGRVTSVENELNQILSYEHDSAARRTKITYPEGNYTEYTYDERGNITKTRRVSKNGQEEIVTTATYPASCIHSNSCNKPTSTTDAQGYRTDYTYDSTHGRATKITKPAPTGPPPVGSGDRPQTRFSYDNNVQARYRTAGGWTNGDPVTRLVEKSVCAEGMQPNCATADDKTVTEIDYPSPSTPNNALPASKTERAGDGTPSATTTLTYTAWGNVKTVEDPLGNTTRFYYDAGGRRVGRVGPDPDGAGGALLHRAVRTTYNEVGKPTVVERGTVPNQSDTAFSSFTVLEKQETEYDQHARRIASRLRDGGSIVALTQFSYDGVGRLQCTAVRMNPASFSSPPSSACSLGSTGSHGPDRITRREYDAAGRVTAVKSAYGTAVQQTTKAYTYTANGEVETLTNARGYRTTYEYDGFDRLEKRRYPDPNTTGQSSPTDYEEYSYNAAGQVTTHTRRSGHTIQFSYFNTGELKKRNPQNEPATTFEYDLLGRVTSETRAGKTLTTTYDALSRVTSEDSSIGTVTYEYDAEGRRTKMSYPGSFAVDYDYNAAGDLTLIEENGSSTLATYAYDGLGRRTSLTRGNGVVTSYTYDPASRLASLEQDPSGSSYDTTFGFDHNPAGQITERTRTNGAYDWAVPSSFTDSYSANGLDEYTSVDGVTPSYDARGNLTDDGTTTYGYDLDNRLTSASGVSLEYDPRGRLHEVDGSATTRFVYDGADVIAEENGSGTVLRRYVHGPGTDEPLVWYEGSGTSDRRWLLADERGSVIGITDDSGAVTQVNTYDAYGVPGTGNDGRFQYTGQMWLEEVGVYHYKARAYDPELGRFLQPDPIGTEGGMNLYGYVGNDPANARDPFGLQEEQLKHIDCNWLNMCTPVAANVMERVVVTASRSGLICGFACRFRRDLALELAGEGVVAQGESPRNRNLRGARAMARYLYSQSEDEIAFDKDNWAHPDAAATHVLPILNDITRATSIELGGYIIETSAGYRIYPDIFIGTFERVPQMSEPNPPNTVAGFHSQPTSLDFSSSDLGWATASGAEPVLLYMVNRVGEIRRCVPGAPSCSLRGSLDGQVVE